MNGGGDGGDKEVVKVLLWIVQKVLFMKYYAENNCGSWYEHQQ